MNKPLDEKGVCFFVLDLCKFSDDVAIMNSGIQQCFSFQNIKVYFCIEKIEALSMFSVIACICDMII